MSVSVPPTCYQQIRLGCKMFVCTAMCRLSISSIMVDTWFGRSMLFLSYGFTERRCTGHSSRHSIHNRANLNLSLAVFKRAIARKESSRA